MKQGNRYFIDEEESRAKQGNRYFIDEEESRVKQGNTYTSWLDEILA